MLTQPIKWHGGKHYLADKIIGLMPPRAKNSNAPASDDPGWLHYVEPFAGGLSVLLAQDPEGISEVVGDAHPDLVNFWQVIADGLQFAKFVRVLEATPFSEPHYEQVRKSTAALLKCFDDRVPGGVDRLGRAVRFFINCRQSMSGRMDTFAPLTRNRTRRGMNEQASAWLSAIEGLPAVHARLRRVVILNGDALKLIRQQDGPRTLFYLDPPYMHETRTAKDIYANEMTNGQHAELLEVLSEIKGRFLLSGYRCNLYDAVADECDWRRVDIEIDNKSGSGTKKQQRVESIWMNY